MDCKNGSEINIKKLALSKDKASFLLSEGYRDKTFFLIHEVVCLETHGELCIFCCLVLSGTQDNQENN